MTENKQNAAFASIERMIERVTLFLGAVGAAAFCTLIFYAVVLRFIFHKTPYWAEELPRVLLVWVTFLGVVVATIRRSHLSADILPLLVRNPAWREAIELAARICTLIFLAFVGWTGWQLTSRTWSSLMPALQIPVAWTYLALPVSAFLACVAGVISLRRHKS